MVSRVSVGAQISHTDEIEALRNSQEEALKLSRDTIASLQATIATLNRQLSAAASRTAAGNNRTKPATPTAAVPPCS